MSKWLVDLVSAALISFIHSVFICLFVFNGIFMWTKTEHVAHSKSNGYLCSLLSSVYVETILSLICVFYCDQVASVHFCGGPLHDP